MEAVPQFKDTSFPTTIIINQSFQTGREPNPRQNNMHFFLSAETNFVLVLQGCKTAEH